MAKTLTPDAVDDAPDVTLADVVDAPEPLRRALPPPEPYPLDALGTILAPMARKLREVVQAPDAICGQSVLGAGTLAVQGHADVTNDGRSHPLSEYLLTVGESGERKSAVDRCALWPHRHWERSLHERYRGEVLAYQNEVESYRKARDEALKQAKGREAKKAALDALGPAQPHRSKPCSLSKSRPMKASLRPCGLASRVWASSPMREDGSLVAMA